MPDFRKDPVTGRWVIIASERAQRPQPKNTIDSSSPAEPCPFCAGNESMTPPEVLAYSTDRLQLNSLGWTVRVVPNKYPALDDGALWRTDKDGVYESMNGVGVHEVIIESPDHVTNMARLSEQQFVYVLRAYRERVCQLRNDSRWRYLLIYKNQGYGAGATLEHVHSQLIALPHVPKDAVDEINGTKRHYEATARCIYCDLIGTEVKRQTLLVSNHNRFIALCPFAPRFAFETWILPKDHAPGFELCSDHDLEALARALRDTILRLNFALGDPPFNYVIHSNAWKEAASPHFHWHIEIMPQLIRAAGFEWGSGAHINPCAPEDAARLLRGVAL
jgi:UDPglucose--hexose-1-phosphate uridylyltransferase